MKILSVLKRWNWEAISLLALWFLVWAGYNTGIERVVDPAFPHGVLDFVHGLRAFLPLVAAFVVTAFLVVKQWRPAKGFFVTPLGLLLAYAGVGIVSSLFSNHILFAFYWALMYGAVALTLVFCVSHERGLQYLVQIIRTNWIVAGMLAVGLLVFFLAQPGTISSLTWNFLVCMKRPYEGLGTLVAGAAEFGMALSRPTGFGRYAGIATFAAFIGWLVVEKKRFWWFLLFAFFLVVLVFSKGKTGIVACIIAMMAVAWLLKKYKPSVIAVLLIAISLAGSVIFLNIPCTDFSTFLAAFRDQPTGETVDTSQPTIHEPAAPDPQIDEPVQPTTASGKPGNALEVIESIPVKDIKTIATLSGRTNGVWADAWSLFLSAPFFGRGFQADRFFLEGQHAHNSILHALVQAGLFGTIPFVGAFLIAIGMAIVLLRKDNLNSKDRIILIEVVGALVFFLVRNITESVAFYGADWIMVAPLLVYIQSLYLREFNRVTL